MMNMRRRFLSLAAASLALPVTSSWAIDPIGRTRPSKMRLSLAAYSYRKQLTGDSPSMDLFKFADLAADMGLDAIEPTSYYFPSNVDDSYLLKLKRHAFMLGLDISGTAIGNNFCLKPGPERDKTLELTKTWIDRAAVLGAPVIRIFAGSTPKGDTEQNAFDRTVEGIKQSLEYASKKGIVLGLENHGGITTEADTLLKLVKAVDSPWFGINFDSGNFHGDDPYGDLAKIAPYAVNVQIKTEISRKGKKKEVADLAKIIGILRDAKYSGYVALEHEADEDPFTTIPKHIKKLRDLIS